MPVFSSRPEEDSDAFELQDLVPEELELIAALLYSCTLGRNISPYRDAASSLMSKIEAYTNDPDFCAYAGENVDVRIKVLDDNMGEIDILDKDHFEILT